MRDTKIALIQMKSICFDIEQNIKRMYGYIKEAASKGADIICFPELSVCGYSVDKENSMPLDSIYISKIRQMAKDNSITVLSGIKEKKDERLYISQLVCYRDGDFDVYRKTHLGENESKVFFEGDEVKVFKSDKATFGIQLCYDLHFGELSVIQSMQGAEIIFAPHASPLDVKRREELWQKYVCARAYDSSVYIACCNHLLDEGTGGLMVINPKGEIISKDFCGKEGILICDLDSNVINSIKDKKQSSMSFKYYLQDARFDLYRRYMEDFSNV